VPGHAAGCASHDGSARMSARMYALQADEAARARARAGASSTACWACRSRGRTCCSATLRPRWRPRSARPRPKAASSRASPTWAARCTAGRSRARRRAARASASVDQAPVRALGSQLRRTLWGLRRGGNPVWLAAASTSSVQ
jgi:hypothetical protein